MKYLAVNPQTGETLASDGKGPWQPVRAVNPETGEEVELVHGKYWKPVLPTDVKQESVPFEPKSGYNAITGKALAPGEEPPTGVGQYGDTGFEGVMRALGAPQTAVMGALIAKPGERLKGAYEAFRREIVQDEPRPDYESKFLGFEEGSQSQQKGQREVPQEGPAWEPQPQTISTITGKPIEPTGNVELSKAIATLGVQALTDPMVWMAPAANRLLKAIAPAFQDDTVLGRVASLVDEAQKGDREAAELVAQIFEMESRSPKIESATLMDQMDLGPKSGKSAEESAQVFEREMGRLGGPVRDYLRKEAEYRRLFDEAELERRIQQLASEYEPELPPAIQQQIKSEGEEIPNAIQEQETSTVYEGLSGPQVSAQGPQEMPIEGSGARIRGGGQEAGQEAESTIKEPWRLTKNEYEKSIEKIGFQKTRRKIGKENWYSTRKIKKFYVPSIFNSAEVKKAGIIRHGIKHPDGFEGIIAKKEPYRDYYQVEIIDGAKGQLFFKRYPNKMPTREQLLNDVYFQSHSKSIQQAIKDNKPVPRHVIEEYRGEPWADEALGRINKNGPTLSFLGTQNAWETLVDATKGLAERFQRRRPAVEDTVEQVAKRPLLRLDVTYKAAKRLAREKLSGEPVIEDKDLGLLRNLLQRDFWIGQKFPEAKVHFDIEDEAQAMRADLFLKHRSLIVDDEGRHLLYQLSPEGQKKVEKALWEGDRLGKVWEDKELAESFGLNESEIGVYRAYRSYFDAILKDIKDYLVREADELGLRKYIIKAKNPTGETSTIIAHSRFEADNLMQTLAREGYETALEVQEDELKKILTELEARKGYMPHIRKPGKYYVTAIKDGEEFGRFHYNSKAEAVAAQEALEKEGYKTTIGKIDEFPEELAFSMNSANLAALTQKVASSKYTQIINNLYQTIGKAPWEELKGLNYPQRKQVARLLVNLRASSPEVVESTLSTVNPKVANAYKAIMEGFYHDPRFEDLRNMVSLANAERRLVPEIKDALLRPIVEEFKARGFMRHGLRRRPEYWSGFEKGNVAEIADLYGSGYAGWRSKVWRAKRHWEELAEADVFKQHRLTKRRQHLVQELLRNQTQIDRTTGKIRSLAFIKYLLGSIKPGVVNSTQTAVQTMPELTHILRKGGVPAHKAVAEGIVLANKWAAKIASGQLGPEELKLLDAAERTGALNANWAYELMGKAPGGMGSLGQKTMDKLGWLWENVEKFNRKVAFLSSYEAYQKAGLDADQAFRKAIESVHRTQGVYGKRNLLELEKAVVAGGLGPTIRATRSLKTYNENLLSHLWSLGVDKKDRIAALQMLATLGIIAGPVAFPLGETVLDVIRDRFGVDFRKEARDKLSDFWYRVANYGLAGALGIDLSGSLQVDMPFLGPISKHLATAVTPEEVSGAVGKGIGEEFTGVPGSLFTTAFKAASDVARGEYGRAAEEIAPKFIGDVLKASREAKEGVVSRRGVPLFDRKGQPYVPTSTESLLTATGFQPARKSLLRREQYDYKQMLEMHKKRVSELYTQLQQARLRGDRQASRRIINELKALREWEIKHGISRIMPRITPRSLRQSLRRKNRADKRMLRYLRSTKGVPYPPAL